MTANTAPTLDNTGNPGLPAELEGATNPSGISIGALVGTSISDPDGVVNAVAITALDTSVGTWQYSTDSGGHWLTIRSELIDGSVDELALLLGPTALIRLLPFGDSNGTLADAITFRAWDESSGSQGDYSVIAGTGGTQAFSDQSETASLAVGAVNDAPTFAGRGGISALQVGIDLEGAFSLTVQPDGKVIVVGGTHSGSAADNYVGLRQDFAVIRLNADGSLDTGFNGTGKLVVPIQIGDHTDAARSVVLLPDGKILVSGIDPQLPGSASGPGGLVRLNADGTLDTSFNGTGKLLLDLAGVLGSALEPDGSILVSGLGGGFALLDADGTSTGTGGAPTPSIAGDAFSAGIVLQPDGKVLLSGTTFNVVSSNDDFGVARLNADGSPDTNFNGGSSLLVPIGSQDDKAFSIALQPDGKAVLAGETYNGSNYDFGLARVNADGTLDTTFNGTGTLALAMGSADDVARSVTVQSDGKIVAAGYTYNGTDYDFALVRLNANGTLDTGFNGTGKLTVSLGASSEQGYSVTIETDGGIVVAGRSGTGSNTHFAIFRVHPDGSLDSTFGSANVNTLGGTIAYTENATPVPLDASVSVYDPELFAAGNYAGATVTLARHGGASADDLFSGVGNLVLSGGAAVLSGVTIGTCVNSSGTLAITFNGNASQVHLNEALSSIVYANASDSPDPSVQIDWAFGDCNAGAQGSGGVLTATSSSTVNITAVNDAPIAVSDTASATEAGTAAGSNASGNVLGNDTDADAGDTKTVIAITGGTVGAARTGSHGTLTLNGDGSYSYVVDNNDNAVNALGPGGSLQDSFTYTMDDTAGASSSTTLTVTIHGQNDAPTGSVTVNGVADAGQTLSAVPAISDPEGVGQFSYEWQAGGVDIANATASSFVLSPADVGKVISVIVSYTDGGGTLESVTGFLGSVPGQLITGTANDDSLAGGNGNDTIDGGLGRDTMAGLGGSDTYYVDNAHDRVVEQQNAGSDTVVTPLGFVLPANVENLTLTGTGNVTATGNALNNILIANAGSNLIYGFGGADTMTGGAGADRFVFTNKTDSTPGAFDTITDFSHAQRDRIDLALVDANDGRARNQAFVFIGTQPFSAFADASGLLRFDPVTQMLEGSTNADAAAEFRIHLVGITGVGTGANQISAADIAL
jgi:uncharacterized delta-60 repeat protein